MRVVNLTQGTQEWLQWRKTGITATDSAVIMGRSPYKTAWRLWAEKTGLIPPPDLSANPNVAYGKLHEEDARRLYEEQTGDFLIVTCGEYEADSTFKASFDGLDSSGCPVEFKCPSPATLADVRENGVLSLAYGVYYVQVQHQCLVADADHGHLVFWDGEKNELIVFRIERDKKLIAELLTKGREFAHCVETKKEPERDPLRDMFIPKGEQSKQWVEAARVIRQKEAEIAQHKAAIEEATEALQSARENIIRLMGDENMAHYAGISVKRSQVAGRVDYQKMVADLLGREPAPEELESYRGKETQRWCIKSSKTLSVLGENTPEYQEMLRLLELHD